MSTSREEKQALTSMSNDVYEDDLYTDDDEMDDPANSSTPLLDLTAARTSQAPRDPAFHAKFRAIEQAIEQGILPQRIVQGSSGSYFCRDVNGEIVGVFKPKNEEPYGKLNPKWTKWIQKMCMPCCFGRACLVPNQGYLSEAGASIVDGHFNLDVVPKTKVVKLVSSSFYYSKFDRARAKAVKKASERFPDTIGKHLRQGLPPKIGSLQMFVKGFQDADQLLKKLDLDNMSKPCRDSLQRQFECLVVLDYITRNTDRGNDNWLINYDPEAQTIKIAAIDNGLSFPLKHPDNWRTYPYHWVWLPLAKIPFSDELAQRMLPLLNNDEVIDDLENQLHALFGQDAQFSQALFEKQMSVLRGQVVNLRTALTERKSPYELVQLPTATLVLQRHGPQKKYKHIISSRYALFKSC